MPKNISSHQDIWIIFTYLFGQSNDCIMMPKIIAIYQKIELSIPDAIPDHLGIFKSKKKKKKKKIRKLILDFY